jgi:hypothetical protein
LARISLTEDSASGKELDLRSWKDLDLAMVKAKEMVKSMSFVASLGQRKVMEAVA